MPASSSQGAAQQKLLLRACAVAGVAALALLFLLAARHAAASAFSGGSSHQPEPPSSSAAQDAGLAARVDQHEPPYLPAPQLPLSSLHRRTYQMLLCRNSRRGSVQGLERAGFSRVPEQASEESSVSRLLPSADVVVACAGSPATVAQVDRRLNGTKLTSSLVGLFDPLCLGSSKYLQLECRRELAKRHGCEFDALSIQPAQFRLDSKEECLALTRQPAGRAWLVKPSAGQKGHGIRYFASTQAVTKAIGGPSCEDESMNDRRGFLAQLYVVPMTLDGYKFDVGGGGGKAGRGGGSRARAPVRGDRCERGCWWRACSPWCSSTTKASCAWRAKSTLRATRRAWCT
jgi:hypothetical protein